MEQRISLITLGVVDLERAREFYEDGMGWVPGFVGEDVIFYQAGGMVVALWSRSALAADAGLEEVATGFAGIAVAHNVRSAAEADAVLATAAAAGGRIVRPAEATPWGGYSGYFADPDGHLWEVAWNPEWILESDGSVRLT